MVHSFECLDRNGHWTGFLNKFGVFVIGLAWRSDGWDEAFGDRFYFRPTHKDIAPELYGRLTSPKWYHLNPDMDSKAWFTQKGYERFAAEIADICKIYELAGIPTRHLKEITPQGKLVVHGPYQKVYACEENP